MLLPVDIYSKTGRLVMDVLRDKHPAMRNQDLEEPECYSFEEYEEDPDVFSLNIPEEDVMWVAGNLLVSASPSGTDAMAFQSCILRFGQESTSPKDEMVAWKDWISNKSPPWAVYHAIMTARLVALDK